MLVFSFIFMEFRFEVQRLLLSFGCNVSLCVMLNSRYNVNFNNSIWHNLPIRRRVGLFSQRCPICDVQLDGSGHWTRRTTRSSAFHHKEFVHCAAVPLCLRSVIQNYRNAYHGNQERHIFNSRSLRFATFSLVLFQ